MEAWLVPDVQQDSPMNKIDRHADRQINRQTTYKRDELNLFPSRRISIPSLSSPSSYSPFPSTFSPFSSSSNASPAQLAHARQYLPPCHVSLCCSCSIVSKRSKPIDTVGRGKEGRRKDDSTPAATKKGEQERVHLLICLIWKESAIDYCR